MFFKKYNFKNFIIIPIIIKIILCQKLSKELLETWGEKTISERTKYYTEILDTIEKYLVSEEGYSLDETDIIPFGFFKQSIDGINYRLLCVIKKKSSSTPNIFDFILHKHNDEFKLVSARKPEESAIDLSEKEKIKMKNAIMKYYFEESYELKDLEIEYEYHKLGGLYNYAIYDVIANFEKEDDEEGFNKRLLIIYRNDKTFTVEEELTETE